MSFSQQASMDDIQDPVSPLCPQPSQSNPANNRSIHNFPPSNRYREKLENVIILDRSYYVCVVVFVYGVLAISSWSVICLLSQRPLTASHYGYDSVQGEDDNTHDSIWRKNENWLQAALVIWSIVNLLTIPLTSTVCAYAAVRFTQYSSAGKNLTLRQTLLLADRGWINIPFLTKFILNNKTQGRNAVSRFVFIALALHLLAHPFFYLRELIGLGIIISPLQQILVTQEVTKRPTPYYEIGEQTDISDICHYYYDYGYNVVKLQAAFQDASLSTVQQNLWARAAPCSPGVQMPHLRDGSQCTGKESTSYSLSTYSSLEDPFAAQLPSGFSTGLLRQYLPRINTTASYAEVDKIPDECLNGESFQASYSGPKNQTSFEAHWSISICLPVVKYPIQGIRDRQDFQEDLYMTIETFTNDNLEYSSTGPDHAPKRTYRLSMETTMGYFELPNYYNGEMPGPLLEKGPTLFCADGPCVSQSIILEKCGKGALAEMEIPWHFSAAPDRKLMYTKNRGPLTTIALALFGNSSYLARAHSSKDFMEPGIDLCFNIAPLSNLMEKDEDLLRDDALMCFTYDLNPDQAVAIWLTRFTNLDLMKTVWDQAAFLSNKLWLIPNDPSSSSLVVNVDQGKNTQKPVMSPFSMIIISLLLGLDLLALSVLAIVASRSVGWTQTLDALALVRIGVSLGKQGDDLLHLRKDADILDHLPGYIGDNAASNRVGTISLGSPAPLQSQRSYSRRLGYTWDGGRI